MSKKKLAQTPKDVSGPKKPMREEDRPPLWQPTWAWHTRTLLIIYTCVIVAFFIVKAWLKPYVRDLPAEITPWLHGQKTVPELAR